MHYTLCDLAADIAQNAAESGASEVRAEIQESEHWFRFAYQDNGRGMSEIELKRAKDPFYTDGVKHPSRRVGLGIPFLIQTARQSGGEYHIESEPGQGTRVQASFDLTYVDTPPLGDVPALIRTMFMFSQVPQWLVQWQFENRDGVQEIELRKSELVEILGNLDSAAALNMLDTFIRSQIQ